ncbi:hypothetical protein NQ314_009346 [Rhamnusium bicolor]|uniref:Uncharacterized protein n=1 Tax=Rhamnusium bicolor TaxID=1586634 RepID=A0AAV8Y0K8_9CUCU|nr:hypothetical protein NQ314_009346 [Rhamnusium bicolor]
MKIFILLATVLSLSLANQINNVNNLDLENLTFDLDHELVNEFLVKYDEAEQLGAEAGITAVINKYADKIFANIQNFSVSHELDPVDLGNVSQKFLTASIKLTDGLLYGISSINRTSDVVVTYRSSKKELEIELPIVFSNLNMKILIVLATILSYTFAIENFDLTSLDFKKARFDLDQEFADKFIEKFEEAKLGGGDESKIIAVIDEYADQIFWKPSNISVGGRSGSHKPG